MTYEIIKRNFERGLWCAAMVQKAVDKGVITQAQANEIIGKK